MLDYMFTLKFTAKQLQRQSTRAEKEEKREKLKLKKVRLDFNFTLFFHIRIISSLRGGAGTSNFGFAVVRECFHFPPDRLSVPVFEL
jgi:hypothetical protein